MSDINNEPTPVHDSVVNGETNPQTPGANAPWWATYAKAVWGSVTAGGIAFGSALLPYLTSGFGGVTAAGWVTAVIALLASGGATGAVVSQVKNADKA